MADERSTTTQEPDHFFLGKVGDRLPNATFTTMTADGPKPQTTDEIFKGKKVVLFAVPGAFTPTCHNDHLPSFAKNAATFKTKGVAEVACVAVNDPFVLGAWEEKSGGKGKVLFLSDGNAEFTRKIGMDFDGSGVGLGTRSKRYAALVENCVVKALVGSMGLAMPPYFTSESCSVRHCVSLIQPNPFPCVTGPCASASSVMSSER